MNKHYTIHTALLIVLFLFMIAIYIKIDKKIEKIDQQTSKIINILDHSGFDNGGFDVDRVITK